MIKAKTNPPPPGPDSAFENTHIPPFDEEHLSSADFKATPRTLCSMYFVNPEVDAQTLLGSACESLASASVMTMDVADHTEGTHRNTLLGITQVIMLAELAVNRALDQLDPVE